ncbi:MAG: S9 family peptidase [Acidobacteria bacterium]|nr:S9 family peptidase [Acidobacteriota bacterium]
MPRSARAADPVPPVAKVVPQKLVKHGDTRVDNYFWLRDKSNPAVIDYLKAENGYTEAIMKPTEPLQEKLYQEILGRIKQTDLSVPERIGPYYYYSRTEQGKQYPILCRKKGSLEAAEEVMLDLNALAKGHTYFRLGVSEVSPDHRLLAYSTDTSGGEVFTLVVKDLTAGAMLKDEIPNTATMVEWGNDNRTLFYTTLDAAKRPYRLYRHVLGADPRQDALIFEEKDETFRLGLSKTRSQSYLLLSLRSTLSDEWHYLDASAPQGAFRLIERRRPKVEYSVDHRGGSFYILTNEQAQNFQLMEAPVTAPGRKNWKTLIPHRPTVLLQGVDLFENHMVVSEREAGLRKIRITDLAGGQTHHVDFPEPVYTAMVARNPEFRTTLLRFSYTSLVTPMSVFDYDMQARTRELKKQMEVLGGYDPARYQSERIFATAADGVKVPISLVYRKGMVRNARNPLWMNGYGSYGSSREPVFSSDRLSLLDRGFIFAIAHIRGGSEMGRSWYEDGKLLRKKNTFTDFVACAEHLVREKYTSPERLVISGGSAGGLLMGAVVNLRPDLFKAVIANVPFVDVISTMLDASIPLTSLEWDEWGNPEDPQYYRYMKSYSPYDNVEAKAYPHLLVTTGLNDPRVAFWEPVKWVAKLRVMKTDKNRLLLRTHLVAGHGGPSGRYSRYRETAFEYAFLLYALGIR